MIIFVWFIIFVFLVPPTVSLNTPSMSTKNYDLVVVGGGSSGITAAKFAATFGKSVVIVEKEKMGGDCTWTGCVPSKSLLASARVANTVRNADKMGVMVAKNEDGIPSVVVDFAAVMRRVKQNIQTIYEEEDSPEVMKKLGIDFIQGRAFFDETDTKAKTLIIDNSPDQSRKTVLRANKGILLATGAKPVEPKIEGLETVDHVTYEGIFDLIDLPTKVTVVGGGPIGCELSQALSRLGAEVTLVASRILPNNEPEAGKLLLRVFENEGITVIPSRVDNVGPYLSTQNNGNNSSRSHSAVCSNGVIVTGELLLVAAGRRPVVRRIGLEEIGIKLNDADGINVDDTLMTNIRDVYAAGDCTGDSQFTHYAGYQGAIAARNILLPFTDPGVLGAGVISTTFTDPEVASVGMSEKVAKEKYGMNSVAVAMKEVNKTDRGICDGVKEGIIKIVYRKKGYKILGATIISPVAGELIAEIATAMKTGLSFDMLATVMHPYPSHSFTLQAMAAEVYYDKLVKSKRILNVLKKIGL